MAYSFTEPVGQDDDDEVRLLCCRLSADEIAWAFYWAFYKVYGFWEMHEQERWRLPVGSQILVFRTSKRFGSNCWQDNAISQLSPGRHHRLVVVVHIPTPCLPCLVCARAKNPSSSLVFQAAVETGGLVESCTCRAPSGSTPIQAHLTLSQRTLVFRLVLGAKKEASWVFCCFYWSLSLSPGWLWLRNQKSTHDGSNGRCPKSCRQKQRQVKIWERSTQDDSVPSN